MVISKSPQASHAIVCAGHLVFDDGKCEIWKNNYTRTSIGFHEVNSDQIELVNCKSRGGLSYAGGHLFLFW